MPKESKRQRDLNGFMTVQDNPISKTGVYPYLGSEIAGHELPEKEVFNVYRPEEELSKPETIASFKLMPLIDDHEVIGDNATAPERKGMQGYIGEQVYFDSPYLRANLMIPSRAAQGLIAAGKIELSPAYFCDYVKEDGIFEGQPYQFVQRNIRANHLALVDEGRTGPDVAVLDHRTITTDFKPTEISNMEFTPEQLEQIKLLIAEAVAASAVLDKDPSDPVDPDKPVVDNEPTDPVDPKKTTDEVTGGEKAKAEETLVVAEEATAALEVVAEALADVEEAAAELADEPTADSKAKLVAARKKLKIAQDGMTKALSKKQPSMDGLRAELAAVRKLASKPTQAVSMDSVVGMIADRDALASKVSQFIGAFDHSRMTCDGVIKYAAEKIGIEPQRVALDAWLHGRKPETARVIAQDSQVTGDSIDNLWGKK